MEISNNSLDVIIYVEPDRLLSDLGPIAFPTLYRNDTDYCKETSAGSDNTLNDTFRKIKRKQRCK